MSEAATTTTPIDTQTPELSLADHEAQFSRTSAVAPLVDESPDDDVEPQPRARRHSSSSVATASDVEQIAELTRRRREAEAEIGISVERKPGESERVFRLRQQVELAEAVRESRKAKQPEPAKPVTVVSNAPTFDEKEPTYDDVADSPDPVQALSRKLAAYDRRREAFEAKQVEHRTQTEAASAEQLRQQEQAGAAFQTRLSTYLAANPTHKAVMETADSLGPIPPALSWAFIQDDKGPELMYYFANHPDDLSDMILLAGSNTVSEQSVALLRRRLHARVQADSTGAAAPAQLPRVVPRPPTPVRTAPMKTERPDPDDDSPLSEHEKRYGQQGRGRR